MMKLVSLVFFSTAVMCSSLKAVTKKALSADALLYRVRVCNAYPYRRAMDVYFSGNKATEAPLAYKDCLDLAVPLAENTKVDFKVADTLAGSFSVSTLPETDNLLLLVIHKLDASSTAVAFDSHVYASLLNSQVAVIDTYKSATDVPPSTLSIEDLPDAKSIVRSEPLTFSSVVAVDSGSYKVKLTAADGKEVASAPLIALPKESYVVLRVGVAAPSGIQSYPEEVIVFPAKDPSSSRSAAVSSRHASVIGAVLAVMACFFTL